MSPINNKRDASADDADELDLKFNPISKSDIPKAFTIETESYPADEAATLDAFVLRQAQAPDLFLGAYINDASELIAFVCATLSSSTTLTHSSMSMHDPDGTSVCIHSVCVAQKYRRRGIATRLLKEYVARLQFQRSKNGHGIALKRILLLAHDDLCALYTRAGFEMVGPSAVAHGTRSWFEMRQSLARELANDRPDDPEKETEMSAPIPPDIMQALQTSLASSSSRRPRPNAHLLPKDATMDEMFSLTEDLKDNRVNKYDILCPRVGCGCLILRSGAGRLVEQEIINLEVLAPQSQGPTQTALPNIPCWIVEPSPMVFENIGFSNSVQQASEGPRIKYLICADCDHGPLGWSVEGGKRFWLICERVGYKIQAA